MLWRGGYSFSACSQSKKSSCAGFLPSARHIAQKSPSRSRRGFPPVVFTDHKQFILLRGIAMSGKEAFPNSVSDIPDSFLYCKRRSSAAFSMSKICCSFIGTLLFSVRISGKKPCAYLFGIFLDMKNSSAYSEGQEAQASPTGLPAPKYCRVRAVCSLTTSAHDPPSPFRPARQACPAAVVWRLGLPVIRSRLDGVWTRARNPCRKAKEKGTPASSEVP